MLSQIDFPKAFQKAGISERVFLGFWVSTVGEFFWGVGGNFLSPGKKGFFWKKGGGFPWVWVFLGLNREGFRALSRAEPPSGFKSPQKWGPCPLELMGPGAPFQKTNTGTLLEAQSHPSLFGPTLPRCSPLFFPPKDFSPKQIFPSKSEKKEKLHIIPPKTRTRFKKIKILFFPRQNSA